MSYNPFLERANSRAKGSHGNKSEKRVADTLSARLMPASGAMRGAKSDAQMTTTLYKFQIECKATKTQTLAVEYGWLQKISSEALATNRTPVLTLSFVDETGKGKPRGDWVAIPLWLFQELTEK